jgi:acetyl-CoA synthetase
MTGFFGARNFLLKNRGLPAIAEREFRWPQLTKFNWGKHFYEPMAKNNHRTALWLVGDNINQKVSFDEMNRRSNQVDRVERYVSIPAPSLEPIVPY